jgi:gamma-glutamyltranspeptidase / glutathione hydrolase
MEQRAEISTNCWGAGIAAAILTKARQSAILLALNWTLAASAQEAAPGGPFAVVAANANATAAAAKMLKLGGSAADAAIAAQMVLGVVEPQSSGLGGGLIILYRDQTGHITALDGLARSPAAYDALMSAKARFSHSGASVGVPGVLRALQRLHTKYGKLPWPDLFEPAIDLAVDGFPLSPYLARSLTAAAATGFVPPAWLRDDNGHPLAPGTKVQNPLLAATLRSIADKGPDAFYVDLAPAIVAKIKSAALPGTMAASDLESYAAVERAALCGKFRNLTVCAAPAPSFGGLAVLEMLGILDRVAVPFKDFLDPASVHLFVEAGRVAEVDRLDVVGDPDRGAPSVLPLLDDHYLSARAAQIAAETTIPDPIAAGTPNGLQRPTCGSSGHPPAPGTSQISIVDSDGAALSMTTTININFGAWLDVGGFFLNDASSNFAFAESGLCPANAAMGNKRAETSMAPIIVTDANDRLVLLGGSAGGAEIVDYVAQALIAMINGASPLAALDAGHVSVARSPYPQSAGMVELEADRGIAGLAGALTKLGHRVAISRLPSGLAFIVRRGAQWDGAADPRRDGSFIAGTR